MTTGADWLDQARRLFDVVRAEAGPRAEPAGDGPGTEPAGDGHGGDDCRWCPVCQLAAVLRGERPEVTEALADVLTTTAAALRTLAEPPAPTGAGGPVDDERLPEDERPPEDEQPPVQRIDIA